MKQTHNYDSILKKFFGKKWRHYEIDPVDVGYFVYSKDDEFEEYYIFGEHEGCVSPYYFNDVSWCLHDDAPAYVRQSEPRQLMVDYENAEFYFYNEIRERFQNVGIMYPDMDLVWDLIKGQSIEDLILDYKRTLEENDDQTRIY